MHMHSIPFIKLLLCIFVQATNLMYRFSVHVCTYPLPFDSYSLVRIILHAYTFMHDLELACKNVLISHNSMMHAYVCSLCNLISTSTRNLRFFSHGRKNPIIRMSLLHFTNNASLHVLQVPEWVSCQFTPLFCQLILWVFMTKGASGL